MSSSSTRDKFNLPSLHPKKTPIKSQTLSPKLSDTLARPIESHSQFEKKEEKATAGIQGSPFKIMSAINDPIAAASSGPSEPVQEVQVDVTKLTALSPEVISKQATVCRFPHRARSLVDKSGNLEKDEMEGL